MKNTIIDLWYGNINPNDVKADEKEKEIIGYIERYYNDLNSLLDESGKDVLERLTDCYDELISDECKKAFTQGFTLAVRLMVESLT